MTAARAFPRIAILGAIAGLAWSCTKDTPTIPTPKSISGAGGAAADKSSDDKKVDVCHMTGSGGHIINVSIPALGAHLGHGDYIAGLEADPHTTAAGDGIHFTRITDAVNAARATRRAFHEQSAGICRITITAAAGVFTGRLDSNTDPVLEGFPLYIDVPDVTLQGGLRLTLDEFGRATAIAENEAAVTTIAPNRPLKKPSEWIIIVADNADGYLGNGVVIDGFAFRSGHAGVDAMDGGTAIFSLRVQNLTVSNNRFEALLTSATDLRAGSARVTTNYVIQAANCTFCLSGPGNYQVSGNTLRDGANVGVFLAPAPVTPGPSFLPPYQRQPNESESASVTNNDIQYYLRQVNGVGTAVRIITSDSGSAGVPQRSTVVVQHNVLEHDSFGLIADAGFPDVASSATLNLTLGGNTFASNCRRDLLVSFTRHTKALGISAGSGFTYLLNSSYLIALGGDVSASNAWYDNPTGSPPYGNSLIVDGSPISGTAPIPYNAAAPCNP